MPRVLLLATTTGYQTRAFGEAAASLGVELMFATDRCHMLDDPWRDHAVPIRFHDTRASVEAIVAANEKRPVDGVLVVGDRPTRIASGVQQALGIPGHPPEAVAVAGQKRLTRERLRDAGLPVPWFTPIAVDADAAALAQSVSYPCVLKPVALSGSRGVMRADTPAELVTALERLRALLRSPDVRTERNEAHAEALVEGFIPGREYAVEGLMHHGAFHALAIFDKPEPLDGPFFEETIYVTPSVAPVAVQRDIVGHIARAAKAIGLYHGPVHAECRVNERGVFVLEVAARPIGGLCARVLRFVGVGSRWPSLPSEPATGSRPLEEVLLRHALGEPPDGWTREAAASGVMMIPIPRRGVLRGVEGADQARAVPGIESVHITAKTDQVLIPLPEGASYLGFIFARGDRPDTVEGALHAAHARLHFAIDPEMPVYNRPHG